MACPWPQLSSLALATACASALACSGSSESPQPTGASGSGTAGAAGGDASAGLPFGRCCGKNEDCTSNKCVAINDGPFFCSQACEPYPDDCPVLYYCEEQVDSCIPSSLPYTCEP